MTERDFQKQVDGFRLKGTDEEVANRKAEIMHHFRKQHERYQDAMVDLYDKHLSEPAVDASIAFHTSQEGEEIIAALPKINQEAAIIGFDLGQTVRDILYDLLDEDSFDDQD